MKKITSVLVAEPVRFGYEHQPFDASFLLTCAAAFREARISFLASDSHLASVSEALPDGHTFDLQPIRISERRAQGLERWSSDWNFVVELVNKIEVEKPQLLLLTSVTKEILFALWLKGRLRKLPPFFAVIHAGLHQALSRPRYNLLARLLSLRFSIIATHQMGRFLILEQSIYAMAIEKDPALASCLSVFPHPLPPDLLRYQAAEQPPCSGLIRIGLLGLCTPQKGLFRFLELAKYARENNYDRVRFEIVGRLHVDTTQKAAPYLKYLDRLPSEDIIPRSTFIELASGLSFAAFLFDGPYYQATASGVMLDCIALGIPVIAESCPLIETLEGNTPGPIGITDNPTIESASFLDRLNSLTSSSYEAFRANILALRPGRTPEALAQILLEQVQEDHQL